ncbi:MAG: DUF2764 family protein [Parachlamydiaceae bacterium]|nr:DUF2764 family protein [Parachlamydiaceae bacterium]
MTNYYFVGVILPELQMGIPPEITFNEFIVLLRDNLNSNDLTLTHVIRRYYDLENFRSHWKEDPLDPYGNLDDTNLEEVLLIPELLPNYAQKFLEKYESTEARLRYFSDLISAYFREEAAQSKGFLKEYLLFERKLRLIQTAFRAKYLNRDLLEELQFENPEESFIQHLISQKDSGKFELPHGFEQLNSIFEKNYTAPIDLHKALCEFRFQKIADLIGDQVFTIDRILGYMVQLILVERWESLDQEKGNRLVDQYITSQV